MNGTRPVSISNSMTPIEYTSLRASAVPLVTCSGDRYAAVPRITLLDVVFDAATARTRPKSAIFTSPRVGDQHVLRLDVAVHKARRVRDAERIEHRFGDRAGRVRRHRAAFAQQFA